MTTKEKAQELLEKFCVSDSSSGTHWKNDDGQVMSLLYVDEILKILYGLNKPEYTSFDAVGKREFTFKGEYETHLTGYDMEKYWIEVKEEIKKTPSLHLSR
jgi:hypothetical protein